MKRINSHLTGWLIAGALGFTGCTQTLTDTDADAGKPVSFGVVTEQTRGAQLDNGTLTEMGVFASMNLSDYDPSTALCAFMYNQPVTRTGEVWSYSPVKKWPQIEGVSFFAYAPYRTEGDLLTFRPREEAGNPRFTYAVPAELSRQIDLLVADPLFDQYYYQTPSVRFTFRHALSCVGFAARKADNFPDNVTISVTEITVSGLSAQGSLTVRADKRLEWEPVAGVTGACPLSIANGGLKQLLLDKTVRGISSDTNLFLPLPQAVGEGAKIAVRARYTSSAGTDEVVFESRLADSVARLEPGRRYVLSLTLSITQVIVDFEIVPWDESVTDIPSFD